MSKYKTSIFNEVVADCKTVCAVSAAAAAAAAAAVELEIWNW